MLLIFHGYPMQEVAPCSENRTGCRASLVLFPQPLLIRFIKFCFYYTTYYITLYIFCQVAKFFFALTLKTLLPPFYTHFPSARLIHVTFLLAQKSNQKSALKNYVLKNLLNVPLQKSRGTCAKRNVTTFDMERSTNRKVVSFDTDNMVL